MRRIEDVSIVTLTLAIFLISCGSADINAQTSLIVGVSEKQQAKIKQIENALDQTCQLSLDETPLNKLPSILSKQMGIVVKIDHLAFEQASIDIEETSFTENYKNVSYRSALKIILNQLEACVTIKNEVLLITTKKKMTDSSMLETRIYGVKDFVESVEQVFDSKKPEVVVEFEPLIELIQTTIAPNSWMDSGDGEGTISGYKATKLKVLVITQMPEAHKKIEDLLLKLRQCRDSQIKKNETAKTKK